MMPDFEQIALAVLENLPDAFLTRGASPSSATSGVVAALREVWNARGTADAEAINQIMQYWLFGSDAPLVGTLSRAVSSLDCQLPENSTSKAAHVHHLDGDATNNALDNVVIRREVR